VRGDLLQDEFLEPPAPSGETGLPKTSGQESDADRLSVFKEFLEGLKLDDEKDDPPEEPEPPEEDETKD